MTLFSDTYREIDAESKGEYKEKGSKFIAYAFPIYSEKEVKKKLLEIKKIEHTANHHCYAFVLNPDKSASRVNDDGEPKYTAGKSILSIIQSNNLTNILIIVVRYFGGVKLGISGLIRSYKLASSNSISNALIIDKKIKERYEVLFKYEQMNDVMKIIKKHEIEIIETDFKIDCKLIFSVNKNDADIVLYSIKKNYKLSIKPLL
ncbi:MAG: YigZ family protein [Bacteroidota bacterium]|nr:YigZ family protein [Bacteroidota bacterium]